MSRKITTFKLFRVYNAETRFLAHIRDFDTLEDARDFLDRETKDDSEPRRFQIVKRLDSVAFDTEPTGSAVPHY